MLDWICLSYLNNQIYSELEQNLEEKQDHHIRPNDIFPCELSERMVRFGEQEIMEIVTPEVGLNNSPQHLPQTFKFCL